MKLLKFFKPHCSPCITLSRVLGHLEGYEITEIDVTLQENKALVEEYQIERVPVLAISPDKKLQGVKSVENIEKWINENSIRSDDKER